MKYMYYVSIVTTVLFCSCNKEVQNKPMLDFKEVSVWVGKTRSVEIISSRVFELEVLDNSIIDLAINNNSMTISGLSTGITTVLIKDTDNLLSELIVKSYNIEGDWKYIGADHGLEDEVIIEVRDADVKSEIMSNIFNNTTLHENIIYQFKPHNALRVYYEDIDGFFYEGKYEWNNFDLTVSFKGKINSFLIDPIGNTAHTVAIIQDFTDEFKQLFPNAGVQKVLFKRHLNRIRR